MSITAALDLPSTFEIGGQTTVNRLGFGAMRLTGQPGNFGPFPDWEDGKALLRQAIELGVNHIDTARAYGPGFNEDLIADALYPYPENLLIATKGGIEKLSPTDIRADGRPETLRRHVEESLRRLKMESIGLYYLHRPDTTVAFEDSIAELARLRAAGKIVRIGVSNVSLEQLKTALEITPIAAVQNRYNPVTGGDDAVLDFTTRHDIAFVPWGPLGANPMIKGSPLADGRSNAGDTPIQAALLTLLNRAPNILPIPGTTSTQHLAENMAVLKAI